MRLWHSNYSITHFNKYISRIYVRLRFQLQPIKRLWLETIEDARGLHLYLRNLWILKVKKPNQIIFHGHLGLGDQICYARLYEYWSDLGITVHVPCKDMYLINTIPLFRYLPNLIFHEIPSSQFLEKTYVRKLKRDLQFPLIVSGHETLRIMSKLFPKDGAQTNLIRTAGLVVEGLYSQRFRENALSLPQISPPDTEYAFLNLRSSAGKSESPKSLLWDDRLPVIEEDGVAWLYSYAKIIDEACELRSAGSAFMCLAIVLGARSKYKFFISNRLLLTDDINNEWVSVPLD